MAKINLRQGYTQAVFETDTFCGNDFTNRAANVHKTRSPYAPNLTRESVGKVKKRTGHYTAAVYPGAINGCHSFTKEGVQTQLIHADTALYPNLAVAHTAGAPPVQVTPQQALYSGMANAISQSVQLNDMLYIFDGTRALVYDGKSVKPLDTVAYVPTVIIARTPTGGGVALEPINLLCAKRQEKFTGTATATVYQLSATDLDAAPVTAQTLQADGTLHALTENTHFTVNRTLGTVTFATPPGISPTEKDNVYITYAKTVEGYADKINRCGIVTIYGVSGGRDRLFVAGNSGFCNYDWYSQLDTAGGGTYFADQWYTVLGQSDSPIMGYRIINDKLATVKQNAADDTNIFLRTGTLADDGTAAFISAGSYQGEGAVSRHCFSDLENEPMFLTQKGDYAITPSDVLGERYAQLRSYYANGRLLAEPNLQNAFAVTIAQQRYIAVNDALYILDGTQYSTDANTPFSHRQFAVFYWTNIGARVLFNKNDTLAFGTANGKMEYFYTDEAQTACYADNGTPVYAAWYTAQLYGGSFAFKKNFQRLYVLLGAFAATGCRMYALAGGAKHLVQDYTSQARYFTYSNFSYATFTYSNNTMPRQLKAPLLLKNKTQAQFVLENGRTEPFALYGLRVTYTQR
ncbi:MAG: hypothetical protein PHG02_00340 [Oscillospiraceae bacterium]|nr:hypothetical protein [Oscillospiraceae bacterium]